MAKQAKTKFVNVGGLRIRAGKTHQQVAEQLNRIGDYYANRYGEEINKPARRGELSEHASTAYNQLQKLVGFDYSQGQDVVDRLRNGDENKDYTTRYVYGSRTTDKGYSHFTANNPNAVYGAKGGTNG